MNLVCVRGRAQDTMQELRERRELQEVNPEPVDGPLLRRASLSPSVLATWTVVLSIDGRREPR